MALDLGGDLNTPRMKFGRKILAKIEQVDQDIEALGGQRDDLLAARQYVANDPDTIFQDGN